mgnify:CR=1 FL=1
MNGISMIDAALLYMESGSPVRIDMTAGEAVCSDVAEAVETPRRGKPVVVRRADATAVLEGLEWTRLGERTGNG